ncbi:hypothetical protein C8Q77DRAFT_1109578 [Trametes polyzona]|nr:hypothetical protein C8Q77DRAFT_1109578 [Trametes polyzona]
MFSPYRLSLPLWFMLLSTVSLPAVQRHFQDITDRRDCRNKPAPAYLPDDIIYEVFQYLDPKDAARAGMVCSDWYRHSLRPSYEHIMLFSPSSSAFYLARTLFFSDCIHQYVKHLTVVHNDIQYDLRFFKWIRFLRPYSLRICRIVCISRWVPIILDTPAVSTAPIIEWASISTRGLQRAPLRTAWIDDDPCVQRILSAPSLASAILQVAASTETPHDPRSYYLTNASLTLVDRRGISRARLHECLEALERPYLDLSEHLRIEVVYSEAAPGPAPTARYRPLAAAHRSLAMEIALGLGLQQPQQCLCSAPPLRYVVPLAACAVEGTIFVDSPPVSLFSARVLLDYLLEDPRRDGRDICEVTIEAAYYRDPFAKSVPCERCGVSNLVVKYFPTQ